MRRGGGFSAQVSFPELQRKLGTVHRGQPAPEVAVEIFKPEDVPAVDPENMPGVKVRWVIDKKRGAENFSMLVFELAPGAVTPLHDHWHEQEMYMLEGRGVLVGDKGDKSLEPGQVMWVAPY